MQANSTGLLLIVAKRMTSNPNGLSKSAKIHEHTGRKRERESSRELAQAGPVSVEMLDG